MGRPRKLREFMSGILKDRASLIKATLTTKRTISSIKVAVLRATTHTSTSSPPEHRLDTILSLGHDIRPGACACIEVILDRLHNTQSPYVALKCLFILHNILTSGSFILKEQLSFYPLTGGQNSLKLSRFQNKSNVENLELSQWVRWYASVLECYLITSRVLGCFFSSNSSNFSKFRESKNKENVGKSSDLELLKEIDSLVCIVEGICAAPESLHYQKLDLVHELVLLVSQDYRCAQYHITARLNEFGDRVVRMSQDDSTELINCLKRLEGCRMRLVEIFANRKRNDAYWDLISQVKMKLEELNEERERGRMVVWKGREEMTELTRFGERVRGTSHVPKLLPCRSQWSGMERVQITVSAAFV